MADSDPRLVYITVNEKAAAETIARTLVEERLAACTNMVAGMTSFYRWQGRVESDQEIILIAKTRADRMAALTERVKALHPYEVPCVIALPVAPGEGNAEFLTWLQTEAGPG
jgi:periplasmic divalent cation tolerance protein